MILLDEPMSKHTTFGVGPADVFVVPANTDDAVATICACRKLNVPHFILGKGSDLLVSDKGYRGVMVSLQELASIEVQGTELVCEAGASLKDVANKACDSGLAGFEFASGIPGSMGGACFMNAGAYDGCMADVLTSVDVLTPQGNIVTLGVNELQLGYRTSRIRTDGLMVLRARIGLAQGDPAEIRQNIDDLTHRRTEKQPLEYGSAGSTFKRPKGYFAGKLDHGLRT